MHLIYTFLLKLKLFLFIKVKKVFLLNVYILSISIVLMHLVYLTFTKNKVTLF